MGRMRGRDSINIRPGVAVLAVLRHLNYQPWFAFAEFVDNALQSFLAHRDELVLVDGPGVKLKVSIELDGVRARERDIGGKDAGTHGETLAVRGMSHTVTWHDGTDKPGQVLGMIGIR